MITIKFFGSAKKSFATSAISVDEDKITVQGLIDYLTKIKPKDTPILDVNNLLVAVNGVDSSAIEGKSTEIKNSDVVSLIPVVHGGSEKRFQFKVFNLIIELMEVSKQPNGTYFLDELRKKFPHVIIQGISSRYVLSKTHARKIISISLAAKKNKTLLSNKLETDILMRFANTTQISQAIKVAGIQNEKNFLVIAIGRKSNLGKLFDEIKPFLNSKPLSKNNELFLTNHFNISKKQMHSIISASQLEDLLAEKAAILV